MRYFTQGAETSQPFTNVSRNTLVIYEPVSVTTGKAALQYTLDNSRLVQQGNATWTSFSSGTLSTTQTFVMPEDGAVRIVNYASSGNLNIKEIVPSLGTSVLPDQVGNSGRFLTTDGKIATWSPSSTFTIPDQTGNNKKILGTNGTAASWIYPTGYIIPQTRDSAGIQAAVTAARAAGSETVLLEPGATYTIDTQIVVATSTGSVTSLSIRCPGMCTFDIGALGSEVAAIKYTGGGGIDQSNIIEGIIFDGDNIVYGVENNCCIGLRIYRCHFKSLDVAIWWHNNVVNGYGEMSVADRCNCLASTYQFMRYTKGLGTESFHGTGCWDCTVANDSSKPVIQIDPGPGFDPRPYGSPLYIHIFATSIAQANGGIILINNDGAQNYIFNGYIDSEPAGTPSLPRVICTLGVGTTGYFVGRLDTLGKYTRTGTCVISPMGVLGDSTGPSAFTEPHRGERQMTKGTNYLAYRVGACSTMSVRFSGANYECHYYLICRRITSAVGLVDVLHIIRETDNAGYGTVLDGSLTFAVDSSSNLTVTNATFPATGVVAYIDGEVFGQSTVLARFNLVQDSVAAATFVSATSFTLSGDYTQELLVGDEIIAYDNTQALVTTVATISYNGGTLLTTVTTGSGVMDATLYSVKYSS